MKKKYLRANHATFKTKEVKKAIMIRLKLRNKFLQDKMNNQGMIIENNAIYVSPLFAGQNRNTSLV